MNTAQLKSCVMTAALIALPAMADEARISNYKSQLGKVRVTELPRATAGLVASLNADDPLAAADVVTAAVSVNGTSAPLIVGSVSKTAPKSAAGSAATAVRLQPKLAGAISKAAVSAAPTEVPAIVSAMCKAQPSAFYAIGVSAAEAAPKSNDRILNAITEALPGLKAVVKRAQADFAKANRSASLALLLKHTENLVAALSRNLNQPAETLLASESTTVSTTLASSAFDIPPPVQGPPFVPGGPTPGEITPSGTVEVPPSGRNYSAP